MKKIYNRCLVFLVILAISTQLWATRTADQSFEGLVDIGGFNLHIDCRGQGHPSVILDAGLAGSSKDWAKVQKRLSPRTRTCTYDRAGYGLSDPGPFPRTSGRLVSELRTLLARAPVSPPYILVGHSFGGYNMRLFSHFYAQSTAALILVDTPHEGQIDGFFQSEVMRHIDPMGLLRQIWQPETLSILSNLELEPIAPILGLQTKTLRAILGEIAAFRESGNELRNTNPDYKTPLVVIMHGKRVLPNGRFGNEMEQQWMDLQRELVDRYEDSTFVFAKESAHHIPREQPELIVDAVQQLLVDQ